MAIGIGLIILLIIWIITIIVFVIAIKLQSNIAWIALGFSSILTIALLIIPTDNKQDKRDIDSEPVEEDYIIIYKNVILTLLILSALAGLFALFIGFCLEPVRPKLISSFHGTN